MARGRPKKCCVCGNPIKGEEPVPFKNKFVHSACLNIAIKVLADDKRKQLKDKDKDKEYKKESKKTSKAELKDALSEEEYTEKKAYYNYIRELMGIPIGEKLDAKIYVISNSYYEKYGMTWKEMYQTLVYLNEILEFDFDKEKGIIGLIPYYCSSAKRFYLELEKIENQNKDLDITNTFKEKIIYINPQQRTVKQLSIEDIGEE